MSDSAKPWFPNVFAAELDTVRESRAERGIDSPEGWGGDPAPRMLASPAGEGAEPESGPDHGHDQGPDHGHDQGPDHGHDQGPDQREPDREPDSARPPEPSPKAPAAPDAASGDPTPSLDPVENNLIGFSLSGGGIRSATFNLGLVQALHAGGLFRRFDYLSTVSGGGYLGACLSSLLNDPPRGALPGTFPLAAKCDRAGQESPQVEHLRQNSNYLTPPGGVSETLRFPALLVRGILANLLLVVPFVLLAVITVEGFWGRTLRLLADLNSLSPRQFFVVTKIALCLALVVPVVSLVGLLRPARRQEDSRWTFEKVMALSLLFVAAGLVADGLPGALLYFQLTFMKGGASGNVIASFGGLGSLLALGLGSKFAGTLLEKSGKAALAVPALLGPLILLLIFVRVGAWFVFEADPASIARWIVVFGALGLCVVAWLRIDVNATSFHAFYRSRLAGAYLSRPEVDSARAKELDEQPLSGLNAPGTGAPYHLFSATLNLQASDDASLHGRSSSVFVFSKHACGSEQTGYCSTQELEQIDPHVDLGTAMAISGAAAAANMGAMTVTPLVFVLTLLNVRLGYWLPNPKRLEAATEFAQGRKGRGIVGAVLGAWVGAFVGGVGLVGSLTGLLAGGLIGGAAAAFRARVGSSYLVRELFSQLDEKGECVNVSDGGHLENLGAYELLRRRCRLIVVGDGEADPEGTCGAIATLIRLARIDFDTEIRIDLSDVYSDAKGLSRKHCALGTIHYPGGQTGYLLYLKSSVTGDEDTLISNYRSREERFPHQSTTDQFFDEEQFEAYRSLGYHVGTSLLGSVPERWSLSERGVDVATPDQGEFITTWVSRLQDQLRPSLGFEADFVALQGSLGAIEAQFQDPDVAPYTYEVYPDLKTIQEVQETPTSELSPDERERKVFHLCSMQVQLMENVFVSLRLGDSHNATHYSNRGWLNLFRRWAQAPTFRKAWAVLISSYSLAFETFCADLLKLRYSVAWSSGTDDLTQRELHYLQTQVFEGQAVEARDGELWAGEASLGRVWVADLLVRTAPGAAGIGTPVDPAGEGVASIRVCVGLTVKGFLGRDVLAFLRIRDHYRQMRLLERLLGRLATSLEGPTRGVSERALPAHDLGTFQLHGFPAINLQAVGGRTLRDRSDQAARW